MSSTLPSLLAMAMSLSAASSVAAAAHWRLLWTSPWAPLLLPTTMMPSALLSLHPRPRTKTHTLARRWRSKARASTHSGTVPANLPQPPHCCHRAATVALCAAAKLCTAATSAHSPIAAGLKIMITSREGLRQVYDDRYVQISIGNEFWGPLNRKRGGTLRGLRIYHRQSEKQILHKPHELIIIWYSGHNKMSP